MSRRKKPDAGQSKPGDNTSQDASDTPSGQGDAPTTGPFAHDPAKVSAPTNPKKQTPQPEPSDNAATVVEVEPETPDTGAEVADESVTQGVTLLDKTAQDTPGSDSSAPEQSTPHVGDTARQSAESSEEPGPKPDTTVETVTIRQGGFWSMLFGGALAASIGVVASPYILSSEMLEGRVPAFLAPQQPGADEDEVEMQLASQDDRLAEMDTRLDSLSDDLQTAMDRPDPAPDLSDEVASLRDTLGGVEDGLADLQGQIGTIEEEIGGLGNRLTAVEDRPIPTSDDSDVSSSEIESLRTRLEEQRADMEAQRSAIEEQRSQIEAQNSAIAEQQEMLATQSDDLAALRDEAESEAQTARESARATLQRAALSRVMTALDTGEPFTDALTDLDETGVEVPGPLADAAEIGVPRQNDLAESFPDAARTALSRVRDTQDSLGAVEIGNFFRNQLGMRSLVPREGDDPDAILSRAEAAVRDARIGDALSELDSLPEDARGALDDWVMRATQRQEALSAANALADRLN